MDRGHEGSLHMGGKPARPARTGIAVGAGLEAGHEYYDCYDYDNDKDYDNDQNGNSSRRLEGGLELIEKWYPVNWIITDEPCGEFYAY